MKRLNWLDEVCFSPDGLEFLKPSLESQKIRYIFLGYDNKGCVVVLKENTFTPKKYYPEFWEPKKHDIIL